MFQASRDVPTAWQADLESVVPRSGTVPWLMLAWYPGIFYEPVQRWVIYQMTPNLDHAPAHDLEALRGPCPRETGTWVRDTSVPLELGGKRWVSASCVSTVQWELFRATNCYPQLWWIIEGHQGGHRWRLNPVERRFVTALHGPEADVPAPGGQPYAEWDNRVKEQVIRADRIRQWEQRQFTPWENRTYTKTAAGLYMEADEAEDERWYGEQMMRWLDGQIEDVARDIPRALLPSLADLPRGDGHFNADADALDASLVGAPVATKE